MKKLFLLIIILAHGCKSSNTQKITCDFENISVNNEFQDTTAHNDRIEKLFTNTNEQFKINTRDFSITFFEVKSVDDNPLGDFKVEQKGDSIFVYRNFLESDNLFLKKFQINSDLVDSFIVKATYHNGYLFFGEEKKVSSLDINTINTGLLLKNDQNLFYPRKVTNDESKNNHTLLEVLKRAKCINKKYYYRIIESENYGNNDKKNAQEQLEILDDIKDLNDLFIEYENLKVILDIKYYISGEEYIKTITGINYNVE